MEWVARLDLRPRIFVPYVPIEFRRETHVAARFSKSSPAKQSEINLLGLREVPNMFDCPDGPATAAGRSDTRLHEDFVEEIHAGE